MGTRAIAAALILMLASGILPSHGEAQAAAGGLAFDGYHSYDEIRAELERIASEYPDIAELAVLGHTWQNREIIALRLTDNPGVEEPGEPDVLVMGSHHGNELPSAEVPLYILDHLAGNYSSDWRVRELVDSRDIWFVPLVNPDGRERAMNTDETWRKNWRPVDADGDGVVDGSGVDLNRNYGHLWGELPGASHDPMSGTYCGPSAFSENETMAIRDLATLQNFSISLSYHTYGDVIYYPWNNGIDTVSPKAGLLEAIAGKMAALTGYTPMQGIDAYPTTGDSDDWQYADTGCLPFTIEMGSQFVTPPEQLEALCEKNLEAALLAIGLAGEPEKALLPDWTVMAYMSADADQVLADESYVDLNEMEAVGSGGGLDIVALHDGMGDGDSVIYHVGKDPAGYNSALVSATEDDMGEVIPASGEAEMWDGATLHRFVSWAMENHPARHYMLVLWGHGDGVLGGFVPDKGVPMMVGDLRPALEGFGLDIVGFDTCSMGHFEVAGELTGIADILIGSEAKEPISGWQYQRSLEKLAADPLMRPDELAACIVNDYLDSVTQTYVTQAAIDLHAFEERLLPALEEFARVSADFAYEDHGRIWEARNITDTFVPEQDAIDLFEFLRNLEASGVSVHTASRVRTLIGLEGELVIASGTGTAHPDARAMAVYFPLLTGTVSAYYSSLGFAEQCWGAYLECARDPVDRPMVRSTTPTWVNTTLGPYLVTATISDAPPDPNVLLFYRLNGGFWNTNTMVLSGGILVSSSNYAVLGQSNGTLIEYYFLDVLNNITEPYEVNWGSEEYLSFAVNATCDVKITDIELVQSGEPWVGDNLTFAVNCTNLGPSLATATIRFTVTSESGGHAACNETALAILMPGRNVTLLFNWTARPGNWTIRAALDQTNIVDNDPDNQDESLDIQVLGAILEGSTFFDEFWVMLVGLAALWTAAVVAMLCVLRRGKRRRRDAVLRSMNAAREFMDAAGQFGADTTEARMALAKAEAALAAGKYAEAEFLVSGAREKAMRGMGGREGGQGGAGG